MLTLNIIKSPTVNPYNNYNSCKSVVPKVSDEKRITSLRVITSNVPNNPTTKSRPNKYTRDIFIQRAIQLNGDKYDYSEIKDEHILDAYSKVPIICMVCRYKWNQTINDHVNKKRGCPQCAGNLKWTYDRFISAANSIHGGKFDYSEISPLTDFTIYTRLNIICLICYYKWDTSLQSHITQKHGCPSCYGNVAYTLQSFIKASRKVHGNIYNYDMITESDIKGKDSNVNLKCNTCNYIWLVSIHDHINGGTGCPNCADKVKYTRDRFIVKSIKIHGDNYDYSLIKDEDITNRKSHVNIICKKCFRSWSTSIASHIQGSGCTNCSLSSGELLCRNYLESRGIQVKQQYQITELPRKRYDFKFEYNGKTYLLEFDGRQHFEYIPFFHGNISKFLIEQQKDILKTKVGINSGYFIIRIDYSQINNIAYHIEMGIESNDYLYVSNKPFYTYILEELNII